MTERALSFGSVAAAYERYRPGYPDEVVDQVLAYTGRPVRTALEIGAGTGKATRLFASRGVLVTATDPDEAMLLELRAHVPDTVISVRAAFEDLPLDHAFDLVFAAASMHWTQPEGRWQRVAAMLVPGGVFANFGGQTQLVDGDLERAVRDARAPFLATDDYPSPDAAGDSAMEWPGSELLRCDRFTDVRELTIPRRFEVSGDDYVGHLSTISAYLELPESVRAQVFERIRAALPAQVPVLADLTVHLARQSEPV